MRSRSPPIADGSRSTRSTTARKSSARARAGCASTIAATITHASLIDPLKLALLGEAEPIHDGHEDQEVHLLGDGAIGPVVDDERQALVVDAIREDADVIGSRALGERVHE